MSNKLPNTENCVYNTTSRTDKTELWYTSDSIGYILQNGNHFFFLPIVKTIHRMRVRSFHSISTDIFHCVNCFHHFAGILKTSSYFSYKN